MELKYKELKSISKRAILHKINLFDSRLERHLIDTNYIENTFKPELDGMLDMAYTLSFLSSDDLRVINDYINNSIKEHKASDRTELKIVFKEELRWLN